MKKLISLFLLLVSSVAMAQPVSETGPRYFYHLSSKPPAVSHTGVLYTKQVGPKVDLFYMDDSGAETAILSGGALIETDPIFTTSAAYGISAGDISAWDSAVTIATSITVYVSPTGSDTSNDCLVGASPCATINHALSELSSYSTSGLKNVELANGTYTEQVVIPTNLTSSLKIYGASGDPDDVIIKSGSSSNNAITINRGDSQASLLIDHVTIKDSSSAISIQVSQLSVGHVKFINNVIGISATQWSSVTILNGGVGHMASIDGSTSSSYSYGIHIGSMSSATISNGINITDVTIGCFVTNGSYLNISGTIDTNITLSTVAGTYAGILLRSQSRGIISSDVNIDGTSITATNLGVQINEATLSMTAVAGAGIDFSNLQYGFQITSNSYVGSGNATVTYTYTNVTTPVYAHHSSVLEPYDNFDSYITWFSDFSPSFPTTYGYDQRYLNQCTSKDYYVATTGNDTTGTGEAASPYKTIQKAVTESAKYLCTGEIDINIADGTYTEDVTIPDVFSGVLRFYGNATTPDNVIWASAGTKNNLSATGTNKSIYVDGIKFQGNTSYRAISIQGGRLYVGYVKFYNNLTAIYGQNAYVEFQGGFSAPSIDGNDIQYATGVYVYDGSYFRTENDFTITKIDTGISVGSSSIAYIGLNNTYSIELTTAWTNTIGLQLYNNSVMQVYGSMTIDGVSAPAGSIGLNISQGSVFFATTPTDTLLFKNLEHGIEGTYASYFGGAAATVTYSGNTVNALLSYDTIINNMVLGTITWDDAALTYGYDERYDMLVSDVPNGASAIAHELDTAVPYTTSGAKLLSLKNNGVEKFYIDKDGSVVTDRRIIFDKVTEPLSISAALAGVAGNVDNGTHRYRVSYVTAEGETNLSSTYSSVTVTDKTVNGTVTVTVPVSPDARVTERNIYRTKAASLPTYYYVGKINNNTGTTYTDSASDASLTGGGFTAKDNQTGGKIYTQTGLTPAQIDAYFGDYNAAVGGNSLQSLTYGYGNFAMGTLVMPDLTYGNENNGQGCLSLRNITTGSYNTAIGSLALYSVVTGSNNVAIGDRAGQTTTGSGNIFIGYQAGQNESGSNKLYIDNSNTTTPLLLGDFSADTLSINGTLYSPSLGTATIGTPTYNSRTHIFQGSAWDTDDAVARSNGINMIWQPASGALVGGSYLVRYEREGSLIRTLLQLNYDGSSVFGGNVNSVGGFYTETGDLGVINNANPLTLSGNVTDGATAIGLKIGNANALSTAGAKIVSFYSDNMTTEKAYIDADGVISTKGSVINRTQVSDADHTMLAGEYLIAYTSLTTDRTIDVPNALRTKNREFCLKDETGTMGTNNVTIDPEGATLIDGASTFVANSNYGSVCWYTNGTNWFVR